MWIKFTSDEELEGEGFQAKYSFIPGKDTLLNSFLHCLVVVFAQIEFQTNIKVQIQDFKISVPSTPMNSVVVYTGNLELYFVIGIAVSRVR